MAKPFQKVLKWVADKFSDNPANMLIITGCIGWALSSAAQIGAILFNPKITDEKKSFLVPQEIGDAIVNIGTFLLITQTAKKCAAKLFSTGKFAPFKVREFLNKSPYKNEVGKLDFNLDDVIKDKDLKSTYNSFKSYGTTVATVGAGILSTNIITPLLRNKMASGIQKNYIAARQENVPQVKYQPINSNGCMKI